MNRVLFSSASNEWATPRGIYDQLNAEFGFNYDPCPLGGTVDGLASLFSQWNGKRVFCNPPYDNIRKFLERAMDASLAVYLIPARTDTRWFHDIVLPNCREIRFIKGRLKFGESKNSAPFPSMIVIFEKA
jgi:site-specific DNA-methyltransferase (adenine-specific)